MHLAKMCSSCGLTIPDDARFCSWCGGPNEVVVPIAAVAPAVTPVQPVMPVKTVVTPVATVPVTPTVPAKPLVAAPVITPPIAATTAIAVPTSIPAIIPAIKPAAVSTVAVLDNAERRLRFCNRCGIRIPFGGARTYMGLVMCCNCFDVESMELPTIAPAMALPTLTYALPV